MSIDHFSDCWFINIKCSRCFTIISFNGIMKAYFFFLFLGKESQSFGRQPNDRGHGLLVVNLKQLIIPLREIYHFVKVVIFCYHIPNLIRGVKFGWSTNTFLSRGDDIDVPNRKKCIRRMQLNFHWWLFMLNLCCKLIFLYTKTKALTSNVNNLIIISFSFVGLRKLQIFVRTCFVAAIQVIIFWNFTIF